MTIDKEQLKALALAAPEGPWFGPEYAPGTSHVFDCDLGTLLAYESIETEQDACLRYVAAANPATVLALLDEIERLGAAADFEQDRVMSIIGQYAPIQEERDQLKAENEKFDEGMRALACQLGAGGYNVETLTAEQLVAKVTDGLAAFTESSGRLLDGVRAENEALRKIISESATACGASVSVECSLEFMAMLPGEISSVVGRLRSENEVLKSQVQTLQAEPNSYQSGHDAGRAAEKAHADNWRAEADGLRRDAKRYRFLRNQHWPVAYLAVVISPKVAVKLGHDCPSGDRLDEQVDGAMKREASHD